VAASGRTTWAKRGADVSDPDRRERVSAERNAMPVRIEAAGAVMDAAEAWHDANGKADTATKLHRAVERYREAMGDE